MCNTLLIKKHKRKNSKILYNKKKMKIMQKRNSGFSLLKFKTQAKMKYSNLLTFFFLLIYNKFVISQHYIINSWKDYIIYIS